MQTFQKIVIVFFSILLLIILIVIGLTLRHKQKTGGWPPIIPQCPDFWIAVDTSGNITGDTSNSTNYKCVNVKNLGTCSAKKGEPFLVMDFSNGIYTGTNGNCAKYTWAKGCNISWDGITYGTIGSPCDSTSSSSSSSSSSS
jgi:hypothetical protein